MIVYTLHVFSGRIFFHLDYKWQNCFQAELLLLGNIASKKPPPNGFAAHSCHCSCLPTPGLKWDQVMLFSISGVMPNTENINTSYMRQLNYRASSIHIFSLYPNPRMPAKTDQEPPLTRSPFYHQDRSPVYIDTQHFF